jgi:NOL1/NOP2/fmu family ribosome biogenesis protein
MIFKKELDALEAEKWASGELIYARQPVPQGYKSPWLIEKLERLGVK